MHEHPPLTLGPLWLWPPLVVAPMAGVTDRIHRRWLRRFGAPLLFAEFVSADGVLRELPRTRERLAFEEDDRPIGIQLVGDDPATMTRAARELVARFAPDVLDLNFGCPVPRVTRLGAARCLLEPERLLRVVAAVVTAVGERVPVTVKFRAGWDAQRLVVPELGPRLAEQGVTAVTLHARVATARGEGRAHWPWIRELVAATPIPVIGNGDVQTGADARRLLAETGAAGVMVARGILRGPWVVAELRAALMGESWTPPTPAERITWLRAHLRDRLALQGPRRGLLEMRKHLAWTLPDLGIPPATLRRLLVCDDPEALDVALAELIPVCAGAA